MENNLGLRKHIVILAKKCFGIKSIYNMVISGQKTIESRWSMHKIAPYHKVNIGDVLLLKEMGSPITAKAIVSDVKFYELTPEIVDELRIKYGKQIGTDKKENWENIYYKKYGTLIWLKNVEEIATLQVPRSNGSAWIIPKEKIL